MTWDQLVPAPLSEPDLDCELGLIAAERRPGDREGFLAGHRM